MTYALFIPPLRNQQCS